MKKRLYETTDWRKMRVAQVAKDGFLCQACGKVVIEGHPTKHPVVDHIKPHKGNEKLFFEERNLQTLHKECHDRKTAGENRRRMTQATGLDGWPIE